jgi:hypothetical protein
MKNILILCLLVLLCLPSCVNKEEHKIVIGKNDFYSQTKKELSQDWLLGDTRTNKITKKPFAEITDISTDEYRKYMFVTKDKIIVSYAVNGGGEDRTIICDRISKTKIIYDGIFATDMISETRLLVEKDFYDTLDVNDPNYQGHIYQKGTFDIDTKLYIEN